MNMDVRKFANRPQLSADVARLVRGRIFDGSYPAGSYVRLEQLAAELGVSVTPVREALFELRAEGLLDQRPHRGFMVRPLTRRDIVDVADVQGYIGGELAHRAALEIGAEALAELERIQDQLEAAYAADDHERAVSLNHDFHRRINTASDSPKLAQLMAQTTRYALESMFPTLPGWTELAARDHRRVLAALTARDGAAARAAMREHLCSGCQPLIDHLVELGVIR